MSIRPSYDEADYHQVGLGHPLTGIPFTPRPSDDTMTSYQDVPLRPMQPPSQQALYTAGGPGLYPPAGPSGSVRGPSPRYPVNEGRPDNSRRSSSFTAGKAQYAQFDEGTSTTAPTRLYNYLISVSIVSRWIIFIVPIMGVIWIPAILGFTKFPDTKVWNVLLKQWTFWLTVVWGGWWASLAFAKILPYLVRGTVGVVAVGLRKYIDWLNALQRYIALFAWSGAVWVSYNPLVFHQGIQNNPSTNTLDILNLINKLGFAILLCCALLLFEKFSIQWIAGKFHERSYAERIADQKFAVKSLVTLYRHSRDVGQPSNLRTNTDKTTPVPGWVVKQALKGVRNVAKNTTTALGNVASEIAGTSILQPNSPEAIVTTALESQTKSVALADRLYYSFIRPEADALTVNDIGRFFRSADEADAVFALFDKDSNGDISLDEMELALVDFYREQQSLEHSMQDLDSAVGRLDNILMSVYFIVAILIIAISLEAQLATVVTGFGTLVLGLSWLIGGSLQEVLTSIIFLFIKHPFDVGDRITVSGSTYTVKEIRLLSTIMIDSNGTLVQSPNITLNPLNILNLRRSGPMSETFAFDVHYSTSFEQIEALRDKMLAFVKEDRRDYLPEFDVVVADIPDQTKMSLTTQIKYKSNWQQAAVKTKRRNKWICALKIALKDVQIFGPSGDPNAAAGVSKYTQIPYETVLDEERQAGKKADAHQHAVDTQWNLSDDKRLLDESEALYRDEQANTARQAQQGRPSATRMPTADTMSSTAGTARTNPGYRV